jgi:hypothetical protein
MPVQNPGPPEIMMVHFVDFDKTIVSTLEFAMAQACPPKRRWGVRGAEGGLVIQGC